MRVAAALMLLAIAVCSMEAAIVSRHKRSFTNFRFKSFKLTRRPDPPRPVEDEAPDTSFVVEKPPVTTKPRLTLEQKFAMDLGGVRSTTPSPFFQQPAASGGLWDFLS